MKIEVIAAWPDRVESRTLDLAEGSRAGEACRASGLAQGVALAGMAVFGQRIGADGVLRDGDRLELLRALEIDPKDARRKRAEVARALKRGPAGPSA